MTWLWIALAGGVGAVLRHTANALVAQRRRPSSLGTLAINVLGSFLFGLATSWAGRLLPAGLAPVVTTGLLGGFTTFSTASVEAAELWRSGRRGASAALASGMLVASVLAAALGLWVGGAP